MPFSLTTLLLYAGVALGIFAAGSYAGYRWEAGVVAQERLANTKADLDRAQQELNNFTANASRIGNAANQFSATQTDLGSKLDSIQKDLKNVQAQKPLPVNCKPDAGRLRELAAAVAATNSAIGH